MSMVASAMIPAAAIAPIVQYSHAKLADNTPLSLAVGVEGEVGEAVGSEVGTVVDGEAEGVAVGAAGPVAAASDAHDDVPPSDPAVGSS
jgi:hypothetical protein